MNNDKNNDKNTEEPSKLELKGQKKEIKLINQGTYGCIYRPGINCQTGKKETNEFLTKIQLKETTSTNEIEIGSIIQKINGFQYYYAPILENCDITLATIGKDNIQKCDPLTSAIKSNAQAEFVSNKIQYVGKNTFAKYILQILPVNPSSNINPTIQMKKVFEKIPDTHLFLLESIKQLSDLDIVHFDLKDNNIMWDEQYDVPKIIDFGLSVQIKKLTPKTYKDSFYTLYDTYSPWCIDIIILSFIADKYAHNIQNIDRFVEEKIQNVGDIKKHCENYVLKSNVFIKNVFSKNEISAFLTQINTYVGGFVGKTWKMVSDETIKNYKTWDNYSIATMNMKLISDIGIIDNQNSEFMKEYVQLLKDIILALPEKRKSLEDTAAQIKSIFGKIKKSDYESLIEEMILKYAQPENMAKIKQNIEQDGIEQLSDDDKIESLRKSKDIKI